MTTDKKLHFLVSYGLVLTLYMLTGVLSISLLSVLVIGITKEFYDVGKTGFSIPDIIADVAGILAAASMIWLKGVLWL